MATQKALDIADNYNSIPGGWINGSNGGTGYQPWQFNIIQGSGFAGGFIGNPSAAGISGLGTNAFAFGMYANPAGSGASATVTRPFAATMVPEDLLTVDFGLNWDSNNAGSYRGFELYNGSTPVLEVFGSDTDDIFIGTDPSSEDDDVLMFGNYGTSAMRLHFRLINTTTLQVSGIGRDGSEVFNQNITIAAPPNKISFYFEEAGDNNPNRQMYFDRLNLVNLIAPEEPTFGLPAETVALIVSHFGSVANFLRLRNLGQI